MGCKLSCEPTICCNDYSVNLIAEDVEKIWQSLRKLLLDKLHTTEYSDTLKKIYSLLDLLQLGVQDSSNEIVISKINEKYSELLIELNALKTSLNQSISNYINEKYDLIYSDLDLSIGNGFRNIKTPLSNQYNSILTKLTELSSDSADIKFDFAVNNDILKLFGKEDQMPNLFD